MWDLQKEMAQWMKYLPHKYVTKVQSHDTHI